MTTIFILLVAYFGLLAALSIAATPYRRELARLGAEVCALDLTPGERAWIEGMMRDAYSWRSAVMLFLVFLIGLFQSRETLDRICDEVERDSRFTSDPRLHEMSQAFFASTFAVNPVFGILAFVARGAFGVKAGMHHNAKVAQRMVDLRSFSVAT